MQGKGMKILNYSRIYIGIIGAGKIIPQSIQAMREQGNLVPVAICSRQERFENTKNLPEKASSGAV